MSWYSDSGTTQTAEVNGDVATVPVAALVPIMSTAASRPLRALARTLLVLGAACALVSLVGVVVWSLTVSHTVEFAAEDIVEAAEAQDDKIFFDLDEEVDNVKMVLMLAGVGVGAVGVALGLVIAVIGGVARQLDRTLAPIGSTTAAGGPMAAVAQSST